ncbi:MAG: hypothetical protein Q9193_005832, partial [Seirophora villosa]
GSGIGRETAIAFATAGAERLVLLGRNEKNLEETKHLVLSATTTQCSTYLASVLDEKSLSDVAVAVGSWDVLILNAGYMSKPASIVETPVEDWWQNFEVCLQTIAGEPACLVPLAMYHENQ